MSENDKSSELEPGGTSPNSEEHPESGNEGVPREEAPAPVTLSPAQLEDLKNRAAKADEHWDRFLRQTADMENLRKRAARERQDALRFANEALLEKLVPVLDNFEMAMAAANNPQSTTVESLRTGVAMIYTQLKSVLVEAGLEEVEASRQVFDPKWHEAVSQEETDEVEEGRVLRQLRKGYKLRERLLRPATVVVAKHPTHG